MRVKNLKRLIAETPDEYPVLVYSCRSLLEVTGGRHNGKALQLTAENSFPANGYTGYDEIDFLLRAAFDAAGKLEVSYRNGEVSPRAEFDALIVLSKDWYQKARSRPT